MPLRIEYRTVAPEAVRALRGMNDYIAGSRIDPKLRYLIEVRVSEINGCGYCIEVHRGQAIGVGETVARLDALATWRTSALFTERERVALDWAENVTLIVETHAPDESYEPLQAHFDDEEIVDLTMIIISMNAWNRLAISFRREAPGGG